MESDLMQSLSIFSCPLCNRLSETYVPLINNYTEEQTKGYLKGFSYEYIFDYGKKHIEEYEKKAKEEAEKKKEKEAKKEGEKEEEKEGEEEEKEEKEEKDKNEGEKDLKLLDKINQINKIMFKFSKDERKERR